MITADGLKEILLGVDPKLSMFRAPSQAKTYTVWSPWGRQTHMSDDRPEEVIQSVQIDRIQTTPDESVIDLIIERLDQAGVVMDEVITDHDPMIPEFRWILGAYISK